LTNAFGGVPFDTQAILPPQTTCDNFNTALLTTDTTACVGAGCAVVAPDIVILSGLECLSSFLWGAGLFCTNNPVGREFMAEDISQANDLCGNNKKAIKSGTFCFRQLYSCVDIPPGSECKNWEKPFADIIDGIWKKNPFDDCTTKSYIVIGVGVVIILAVL